jgi:glycosyltransferase involved in cell wall biosynthesis
MKISVAMMVKNEEANLGRCLKSVLAIFPEIIVLDTGSSDKTVEIAQKYTRHVYHQSWQDNFALHRNKSFSYATGDWIIQIDADEELMFDKPEYAAALIEFLKKVPDNIHACALLLKDWRESKKKFMAEHDVVRVFRNGKVKYKRRIHNEPVYKGDAILIPNGIWLKHYGYDLTPEQTEAKAKRTIGLLELSLKEDPKDYPSLFYLAQAYASWKNDADKALEYAEQYFQHRQDLIDSGEPFNPSIFYMAAGVCDIKGDIDGKLKWMERGFKYNPNDLDLFWLKLLHGLNTKNTEFIVSGASGFVAAYENYNRQQLVESGKFVFNRKLESYAAALYYLAAAHLENGVIQMRKLQRAVMPQCPEGLSDEIDQKFSALLDILKLKDTEVKDENTKDPPASEHHHKDAPAPPAA